MIIRYQFSACAGHSRLRHFIFSKINQPKQNQNKSNHPAHMSSRIIPDPNPLPPPIPVETMLNAARLPEKISDMFGKGFLFVRKTGRRRHGARTRVTSVYPDGSTLEVHVTACNFKGKPVEFFKFCMKDRRWSAILRQGAGSPHSEQVSGRCRIVPRVSSVPLAYMHARRIP